MSKCDDCYWLSYDNKECIYNKTNDISNKIDECKDFSKKCEECKIDMAEFKYNDKMVCKDCLLEKIELEEISTISYYYNGEYVGDDNDVEEVYDFIEENFDVERIDK